MSASTPVALRGLLVLALAPACVDIRNSEVPDWFDSGSAQDVEERISWDESPYSFPADPADGLLALRHGLMGCYSQESRGDCDGGFVDSQEDIQIFWGPDAPTDPQACHFTPSAALPATVDVMVTLRPQFYTKARSCEYLVGLENGDPVYDEASDKYYASFFVEDATGGLFVLADQRIAHFDAGDMLRMKIRSIGRAYQMDAVYAYDIEAVERSPRGIAFEVLDPTLTLGPDHRGRVMRSTGVVATEPDDFGTFTLRTPEGTPVNVQLALELNRRGVEFPVGTEIQVTGPVLYSYSSHTIVLTQTGQVEVRSSPE